MPLYTVAGFKVYLPQVILGILVSFLWYGINYVGAKLYGIVQTVMIVIFIVLGFCTVGLSLYKGNPAFFIENMWGNLSPIKGIVSVLALAGFFYIGFDMIPQAAEEYKAEPKKLARLIQGSIIVGTIWYMLIGCMIAFQIPKSELPNLSLPAASAVARTWGQAGFYIVLFLGIIGIVTTYSASFYSSSRVLFGLARGKLFPKGFAKLHPKHGTPTLPITIAAIASIIAVFLGRAAVMWFLDATSAFVVLFYLYIACSYITLRKQEPEMNRPYRAPGGILTGIVAVGASIFFFLSLILPFSPGALIWPYEYAIFIIFLIIATIIYVLMAPTLKETPVEEYEWLVLGIEGDKER
jgi:amino acid transporter